MHLPSQHFIRSILRTKTSYHTTLVRAVKVTVVFLDTVHLNNCASNDLNTSTRTLLGQCLVWGQCRVCGCHMCSVLSPSIGDQLFQPFLSPCHTHPLSASPLWHWLKKHYKGLGRGLSGRTLDALPEEQDSIPRTHMIIHNPPHLQFFRTQCLFLTSKCTRHACGAHT